MWKDRLTAFDGAAVSYDEIGNPTQWHTGAAMTWQHGRRLASYTADGTSVTYAYNADGVRTAKTVNGVTTQYTVVDGTLRRLTVGADTLQFVGNTSVIFNGTEYWYVYNAQGDVIGLIDNTGTYVVQYTYDVWGKPLSKTGSMADTLGVLNPFRYRGYIYDEETGLYYVSSRYYDPAIGRWLNADKVIDTRFVLGNNLYAYCLNNPLTYVDYSGESVLAAIGLGLLIAGLLFIPSSSDQSTAPVPNEPILSNKKVPDTGEPGSHVVSPDGTQERVYGPDGRPQKDRHHTDHGNSKNHPDVPHDHDWGYNEKGEWKPGPGYASPPGPLVPVMPSVSIDFDWEMPSFYFPNPYTGDDSFGAKVKEFFISIFG